MADICVCDYCKSTIQYDESDLQVAFGVPNQIYVTCPVCGKPITVGTADYPNVVSDYSQMWQEDNKMKTVHIVEMVNKNEMYSYLEVYDTVEKALAAYEQLEKEKGPEDHIIVSEYKVM